MTNGNTVVPFRFNGTPEFVLDLLEVELMNPNFRGLVVTAPEPGEDPRVTLEELAPAAEEEPQVPGWPLLPVFGLPV